MLLLSCSQEPKKLYFAIQYEDTSQYEPLSQILVDNTALFASLNLYPSHDQDEKPDIYLIVRRFWEYERTNDEELVLAQTCFVPCADASSPRRKTTLADCLAGLERIIPAAELAPPNIALRVDGLSLDDDGYPLVQTVTLSIRENTVPEKAQAKKRKRIEWAAQALKTALEESITVEKPAKIVWIAAAGDLMLERGAQEILLKEGPAGIFGETAPLLLKADVALLNLEGTVSSKGKKITKSYNFRFRPEVVPALKDAGIDAVLCANNHIFDYGYEAFIDTLSYLKGAGIGALGAGLNEQEATQAYVFSALPYPIQVFGLASFPREQYWDGMSIAAGADKAGILYVGKDGAEKLHFAPDDTTLDIVLFHGGVEWSHEPSSATRSLCADLVEKGADLIIGSHPHIVQRFEWVHNAPVFWSLGNFVFSGMDNSGGDKGLFVMLGFLGKRLFYLEQYPLILSGPRTSIAF
jgi:poly-gamma-glutamate synthesis protein (capsule biosynthesis protein)